jgi:hypothetical protein
MASGVLVKQEIDVSEIGSDTKRTGDLSLFAARTRTLTPAIPLKLFYLPMIDRI